MIATFTKDTNGTYTAICRVGSQSVARLEGADYDPDMQLSDGDLNWDEHTLESVLAEDRQVMATGRGSSSTVYAHHATLGLCIYTNRRLRTAEGGVFGRAQIIPVGRVYGGWYNRLDHHNCTLPLREGRVLSQADLTLLHMLLLNLPRKIMAAHFDVSVKAIEKRLARIKNALGTPVERAYSIQQQLHYMGLATFLLAQQNWFNPQQQYQVNS